MAYGVPKFFRYRKLVVDIFHLLGVIFIYHIKYFVFDSGTFVTNLHALLSFFLYVWYLSTVALTYKKITAARLMPNI